MRSTEENLLEEHRTKTIAGDRANAAPVLWNKLPQHLRELKSLEVFKRDLKTHLFKVAFPK